MRRIWANVLLWASLMQLDLNHQKIRCQKDNHLFILDQQNSNSRANRHISNSTCHAIFVQGLSKFCQKA